MSTHKSYRSWAPHQPFLLPPSPRDWLPTGHLAYLVLELVTEVLDLSIIEAKVQARDPRGNRPYSPRLMVALLLYGYCTGVFSSRRIEQATYDSVAFRAIAGGAHPDHSTIAQFRRNHIDAFQALFVQVVKLCKEMGMLKLGRFAIDGTKVKADASRHKAMSYEFILKAEARIEDEIAKLLERAEQVDRAEDEEFGERGFQDLPEELQRRRDRLAKLKEAKAALERGAREARADELDEQAERHEAKAEDDTNSETTRKRSATLGRKRRERAAELRGSSAEPTPDESEPDEAQDDPEHPPPTQSTTTGNTEARQPSTADPALLPTHTVRHTADGVTHPRAQWNFTDPQSQIMEYQGGFIQAYNVQSLNDESGVIVAQAVTNVAPDTHHLPALVTAAIETLDSALEKLTADAGYWAPENAAACERLGVDAYISTSREQPTGSNTASSDQGDSATGVDPPVPLTPREQMRAKVNTEEGNEIYRTRKWVGEPPFGNIKEIQGFRQFSLRGLELVRGEWSLVAAAHNIRKIWLAGPALA